MITPNRIFSLAARTLLAVSIAAVCGSSALAQTDGQQGPPPGGPGHRGMSVEQRLAHLTKALSLNETQQAQVKEILTNEKSQMDALMGQRQQGDASTPPSREEMQAAHKQMRTIREQTRASITAILDDTQKAKYAEMEERRGGRNGQGGEMPPPPDGNGPPGA
jgi:Spy/CpxP family protein refolding chaperone